MVYRISVDITDRASACALAPEDTANVHILRPSKEHVEDKDRHGKRDSIRATQAKSARCVKEDRAAIARDIDHGQLIRELCLELQSRMKNEAANSNQGKALREYKCTRTGIGK